MESCLPLVLRSHLYSLSIDSNLYLVFRFPFLFFGGGGGYSLRCFILFAQGVGGWVGCRGLRRGCAGAAGESYVKAERTFSLRNIPY